ncbi:MAG: hypothetical protein ACFCVC_21220 [Acidimicrobiia bacterium]
MDQVHRSEWVEWLDGLRTTGSVDVSSPSLEVDVSEAFRLIGAQYVPLADTIELVLDDGIKPVQVTLDCPTAIWVDAEGTDQQTIIFDCLVGRVALGWCGRRSGKRARPVTAA